MKRMSLALLLAGAILFAGCKKTGEQAPQNSFIMTLEDLVSSEQLVVKHLKIRANGKRTIKITEDRDSDEATIGPRPNASLMEADIVLVADLIKDFKQSGHMVKWLVQIKGFGVTVGGPSFFAAQGETLEQILTLDIREGTFPLGQDIEFGRLQDRPLVLSVR
jgi:hypothetical protein